MCHYSPALFAKHSKFFIEKSERLRDCGFELRMLRELQQALQWPPV